MAHDMRIGVTDRGRPVNLPTAVVTHTTRLVVVSSAALVVRRGTYPTYHAPRVGALAARRGTYPACGASLWQGWTPDGGPTSSWVIVRRSFLVGVPCRACFRAGQAA